MASQTPSWGPVRIPCPLSHVSNFWCLICELWHLICADYTYKPSYSGILGLCNNLALYLLKKREKNSSPGDYNEGFYNSIKIHLKCTEVKKNKKPKKQGKATLVVFNVFSYSHVSCLSHLEMQCHCEWYLSSWNCFILLCPICVVYHCIPVVLKVFHVDPLSPPHAW